MEVDDSDEIDLKPQPHVVYKGSYPIAEIENVRAQLIQEIYEETNLFLSETRLNTKRKCGLFSHEVIDYFRHDIKPSDDLKELCDEDIIPKEEKPTLIPSALNQPLKANQSPKPMSPNNSLEESAKPTPYAIENSLGIDSTNHLCRSLKLAHGCAVEEFRFCPRDVFAKNEPSSTNSIVFICDNCQATLGSQEGMLRHLTEKMHLSASEYFVVKSSEPDCPYQLNHSVIGIKSRCSLTTSSKLNELAVFCPKCSFCFGTNIVPCCIHFKQSHNSDEFIFSMAKLKKIEKIHVKKNHGCFQCTQKFKKLTDLTAHLESAKHFPKDPDTELSVLFCPIDGCGFRSIHFFPFKQHLLTHNYFKDSANDATSNELSITVSVYMYEKPSKLFHVTPFFGNSPYDIEDEAKWIECLVELIKGHNDYAEVSKKLKLRKDNLKKQLTNKKGIINRDDD